MADGIAELVKAIHKKPAFTPCQMAWMRSPHVCYSLALRKNAKYVSIIFWNNHITGNSNVQAIKEAAERGVRVRLKDNLRDSYLTGSSATSLHAKTFESDGEKVYIGSFKFDPRSALPIPNCTAIAHPVLANKSRNEIFEAYQQTSYTLSLKDNNIRSWPNARERSNRHDDEEPQTKAWQRTLVRMLSHLPLENFISCHCYEL